MSTGTTTSNTSQTYQTVGYNGDYNSVWEYTLPVSFDQTTGASLSNTILQPVPPPRLEPAVFLQPFVINYYVTNYAIVYQVVNGVAQLQVQQYSNTTQTWSAVSNPAWSTVTFGSGQSTCSLTIPFPQETITVYVNGNPITVNLSSINLNFNLWLYANQSLTPATLQDFQNGSFSYFDSNTQNINFTYTNSTQTTAAAGTLSVTPVLPENTGTYITGATNNSSTPGSLGSYLSNYQTLINGTGLTLWIQGDVYPA